MWKRDDAVKPAGPGGSPAAAGTGQSPQNNINTSPAPEAARSSDQARGMEKGPVNIGKSVIIKGELTGSEDLTIEGHVEGKIELRQNVLTIGPNGRIKAQVFAKSVIVLGEVTGNVTASDKVDIRDNGSVDGDIISPRVAIAEGAHLPLDVECWTFEVGRCPAPTLPGLQSGTRKSLGSGIAGPLPLPRPVRCCPLS